MIRIKIAGWRPLRVAALVVVGVSWAATAYAASATCKPVAQRGVPSVGKTTITAHLCICMSAAEMATEAAANPLAADWIVTFPHPVTLQEVDTDGTGDGENDSLGTAFAAMTPSVGMANFLTACPPNPPTCRPIPGTEFVVNDADYGAENPAKFEYYPAPPGVPNPRPTVAVPGVGNVPIYFPVHSS